MIPSATPDRVPSRRRRAMLFAAIVVASGAGAIGYAGHAGWRARAVAAEAAAPVAAPASLLQSLPPADGRPYLLFRQTAIDATHGRVGLRFLDAADSSRVMTPLSCERVHLGAERGVCLQAKRGMVTSYHLHIFDRRFAIQHTQTLTGPPSRARMSPDGRIAAVTVFVNGHSYASTRFSTRTSLLDATTGQWIAEDLEQWTTLRDGQPFKASDFNFWGVTFTRDARRFYATLQTDGRFHLVEGDVQARTMRVIHDDVECPSLSPDNTRVAFKRRVPTGSAGRFVWKLVVLDLASGRETVLDGETRSVDDQVEWLDDAHIAYALPDRDDQATAALNIWALRVDGTAKPRLLVPLASSPASGS